MQYEEKTTKLGMRSDFPTGCSSSLHGANINSLGFNIDFIMVRDPSLAVEIQRLFVKATALQPADRLDHHDFRFTLANEELMRFQAERTKKD